MRKLENNKIRCSNCSDFKDISLFSKRGLTKDGKQKYLSWCKGCISFRINNRPVGKNDGQYNRKSIEYDDNTKLCTVCNIKKPKEDFRTRDKRRNTLLSYCHRCHSLKLKSKEYNVSIEFIEKMMLEQNGLCKICNKPQYDNRDLYIDHDHLTGKVRGLLCNHCNAGLGKFRDSPDLLKDAAKYLIYHHSKRY